MKIYKDDIGLWHFGERVIPAGYNQAIYDNNDMVRIISGGIEVSKNISEFTDESGTPYSSFEDLLTKCRDFFVNPRLEVMYGELFGYNNSNTLSIPSGTTFTKASPFTNVGSCKNTICSSTTDNITITKDGFYKLNASFSSFVGTNNVNLYTSIFVNGMETKNIRGHRFVINSNYVSTISLT